MSMTVTNLTEMVNLLINKALAAGMTANQISVALNNGATNLGAIGTPPTHDRTITDTGQLLNPSQP
jgi:hypothetical protein